MITMGPRLRKIVLTTHIIFSVGWIGTVAAFVAFAVASLTGNDQLCGKIGESLQHAVGKSFKSIQAFGL